MSLSNIGNIHLYNGDCNQALELYKKSLKINTKIFGEISMEVAASLNQIGSAYSDKRDYSSALTNLNKSM
jgi:hypothetical protein